jgi:hypothetical protein
MMRSGILLFTGLLLVVLAGIAVAGDEPWFDMEKCAFCKNMAAEEGLLEHMHMEFHKVDDGLVSVFTVDHGYEDKLAHAQAAMEKVAEDMQKTGEVPYMCGHCKMYGSFMMSGLMPQTLEGKLATLEIWKTDDAEMVKKLHKYADRSTEEMAKMEAAGEAK